jgi:hypothetical protein
MFTAPPGRTTSYVIGISVEDLACQALVSVFGIDPTCDLTSVDLRAAYLRVAAPSQLFDDPTKWYCTAQYAYLSPGIFNAVPTQWRGPVDNMTFPNAGAVVPNTARVNAVNGGSFNAGYNTEWLALFPGGTIATFTVQLPPGPGSDHVVHGRIFTITTTQPITSLVIAVVAGQAVLGQPGTLSANGSVSYQYDRPIDAWICLGGALYVSRGGGTWAAVAGV